MAARKPLAENCRWFDSPAAALSAGFRPCRRCHPLGPEAAGDPVVQRLLAMLNADPARRWTEADVAQAGLDPSTVRRAFRRHTGMTFLELARHMRLREGMAASSWAAASSRTDDEPRPAPVARAGARTSPSRVGVIGLLLRTRMRPTETSSALIRWLTADGVMCSCSAAASNVPASSTADSVRSASDPRST